MRFDMAGPIAPTPIASLPPLPSGEVLKIKAPGLGIGLGGKLWPASATMCRFLRSESTTLAGKHVLELGCGCGAVGLYAAALGAASVLLTDGGDDELLEVAAGNMGANHRLTGDAQVSVASHSWAARDIVLPPRLDLVLGSDVTYARKSHDALCRSIRWMMDERAPRVLMAHEHRSLLRAGGAAVDVANPLLAEGASSTDEVLLHLCDAAASNGLTVSTLRSESRDGSVTEAQDGAATWTDHLIVRGEATSIFEVTLG